MSYTNIMKGLVSNTEARNARVDLISHTLQIIESDHHEIHSGSTYRLSYNADTSNGSALSVAILTPNTTTWAHFTFTVITEAECLIQLWEAATFTGGSAATPRNANRNVADNSAMVCNTAVTANTTGATLLDIIVAGGPDQPGSSGANFGGAESGRQEWILKQNTQYIVMVTNQSGATAQISIHFDWYEQVSKT